MLEQKVAQFAPTDITYDESLLDDRQRQVVHYLYRAAQIMDALFLEQVAPENATLAAELSADTTPEGRRRYDYFRIMYGRYDRLDHNRPFCGALDRPKPPGANFYPTDITKQAFNAWLAEHPEDVEAFTSEFTVIRRDGDRLVAIPYSEFYREQLEAAADLLRTAAQYADNPTVRRYLLTRATALLQDDYFDSDVAWMDLADHTIEPVIGPYEVYEDELFNYKAAFECFITLRDPEESRKLDVFTRYLDVMEENLPIPDAYKNFGRGSESPMVVVQVVYTAGDTRSGAQTLAFNLPNDERVREAKGSKKVMLKNIHEAKFEKLLRPIAERILDPAQLPHVTFDGFFNHTLMHEIAHGLGPGTLLIDGRRTSVKQELRETYTKIEECKADTLGMYTNMLMLREGVYPASFEPQIWATFLASVFRSVRFGISEAHGASNAIIYNYLLEHGAYEYDRATGRVRVNFDTVYDVVESLARRVLIIEAEGDYEGACALLEQYAVESPSMATLRARLSDVPVDIRPIFQIDQQMASAETSA